jgi:hypothetical protein
VVSGPARKLQRRARRDDVQPALGIDGVAEGEQVVLIGSPAMVEHEQPRRLTLRRPLAEAERAHAQRI